MKINNKILSIPPYISTAWKNITSLHVENRTSQLILIIGLNNGAHIEIPHLDQPVIEAVFAAHAKFLEQDTVPPASKNPARMSAGNEPLVEFGLPLKLEGAMENLGTALQHNPEQMNAPDIPLDVLARIAAISKAVGITDPEMLPKPEPHCNCPHCQITRAIHAGITGDAVAAPRPPKEIEEEVSESDLKFRLWDIAQTAEKLYTVTNPLDSMEHYNVFLGEPIGCTCGQKNCEHIRAVLNS